MTTPREQAEAMVDAATRDGRVVTTDEATAMLADALERAEKAEAAREAKDLWYEDLMTSNNEAAQKIARLEAALAMHMRDTQDDARAAHLRIARLEAVVEAAKKAQAKADRLSGWITNVVRSEANKIHPDWLAERADALVAFDEAASEYHATLAALEAP